MARRIAHCLGRKSKASDLTKKTGVSETLPRLSIVATPLILRKPFCPYVLHDTEKSLEGVGRPPVVHHLVAEAY